jgi:hypothetical protein
MREPPVRARVEGVKSTKLVQLACREAQSSELVRSVDDACALRANVHGELDGQRSIQLPASRR